MRSADQAELAQALAAVERVYGVRVIALTPAPYAVIYGAATLDAWAAAVGPAYGDAAEGDADDGVDPVGEGWDEDDDAAEAAEEQGS